VGEFVVKNKDGDPITDWREWARPKKASQWRAGRSAMELARAWFTAAKPCCPTEIADLLATHPRAACLELSEAYPEYVTSLPERGEGRNRDLLIIGSGTAGRVAISVEAKADEPFGDETIGSYWIKATRSNTPTNAPKRIAALTTLVFGPTAVPDKDPWNGLRYQLLTAIAGAAIEASRRQADTAVVIIHEFLTQDMDVEKIESNAEDLDLFITTLLGVATFEGTVGRLHGPAILEPSTHLSRRVAVLIGKAVFDWQLPMPAGH
jgi:hypothetical protein